MEIVRFSLESQLLAFPVSSVREVVPLEHLAAVFNAPKFVLGLTNVRGEAIPVFDPGILFDIPRSGDSSESVVIIVETGVLVAGIRAERPVDILEVPDEALSEASRAAPHIESIRHVVETERGLVLLLDVERLMTHDDVRILRNEGDLLQL